MSGLNLDDLADDLETALNHQCLYPERGDVRKALEEFLPQALDALAAQARTDAEQELAAWEGTPVLDYDKMSQHKENHYDARRAARWLRGRQELGD